MEGIVVGADGSEHGLRAVEWAAEEAARRNAPLRIVFAIAPWLLDIAVDPGVRAVRRGLLDGGDEVLASAVDLASRRAPGVAVSAEMVPGGAARALLGEAADAAMLVVGGHGAGELTRLLLGSVALQVASHAPCPAVVVRSLEPSPHREVVVGVAPAQSCAAAIGFGFDEAALRTARLRAVLAWSHPVALSRGDLLSVGYDRGIAAGEQERLLIECLAGWRERFPDVAVTHEVTHGRPSRVLAEASAGADLLVVGGRGRGGLAGLVLGSVGHAMLRHSHCPLAVVPPSESRKGH